MMKLITQFTWVDTSSIVCFFYNICLVFFGDVKIWITGMKLSLMRCFLLAHCISNGYNIAYVWTRTSKNETSNSHRTGLFSVLQNCLLFSSNHIPTRVDSYLVMVIEWKEGEKVAFILEFRTNDTFFVHEKTQTHMKLQI